MRDARQGHCVSTRFAARALLAGISITPSFDFQPTAVPNKNFYLRQQGRNRAGRVFPISTTGQSTTRTMRMSSTARILVATNRCGRSCARLGEGALPRSRSEIFDETITTGLHPHPCAKEGSKCGSHPCQSCSYSRVTTDILTSRKVGGEGGIRTHVPLTRQDAFEAPPLRPLRYLSVPGSPAWPAGAPGGAVRNTDYTAHFAVRGRGSAAAVRVNRSRCPSRESMELPRNGRVRPKPTPTHGRVAHSSSSPPSKPSPAPIARQQPPAGKTPQKTEAARQLRSRQAARVE